jgi:hypothetical protein
VAKINTEPTAVPLARSVSRPKMHDPRRMSEDLTNWERDPLSALSVAFKTQAAFSLKAEYFVLWETMEFFVLFGHSYRSS